jgi:hypothetical protein
MRKDGCARSHSRWLPHWTKERGEGHGPLPVLVMTAGAQHHTEKFMTGSLNRVSDLTAGDLGHVTDGEPQ